MGSQVQELDRLQKHWPELVKQVQENDRTHIEVAFLGSRWAKPVRMDSDTVAVGVLADNTLGRITSERIGHWGG
jgi:hypothetical protein